MIVRKWAKFKERSGAETSEIWESTSKARKASGVRLSGGGGAGRGSVPASLGTPMGRSISSLSNTLSIHELNKTLALAAAGETSENPMIRSGFGSSLDQVVKR